MVWLRKCEWRSSSLHHRPIIKLAASLNSRSGMPTMPSASSLGLINPIQFRFSARGHRSVRNASPFRFACAFYALKIVEGSVGKCAQRLFSQRRWASQYSGYKPVFLNRHTEANHNMGSMDRGIRYVMFRATTAWPAIRATTIVNAPTGSMDRAGNLDRGTDGDSFSKR